MAKDWFDSLPDDDSFLDDTFSQNRELDVLDQIFGGGLRTQAKVNFNDPTFERRMAAQREAEAEREQYFEEKQRMLEREQTRSRLSQDMEYEDIPLFDRALLGLSQGGTAIQRQIGGIADALRIPGGREFADEAGDELQKMSDLTNVPDRSEGLGGQFIEWFTQNASSAIPSLVTGAAGGAVAGPIGATVGLLAGAGGQSFGSVFEDAQDAYIKSGVDPDTARNQAYIPATAAGAITAALTFLGRNTGIEALVNREAVKRAVTPALVSVVKGAGQEAIEESADQLSQGIIEFASYNPDKTISQIVGDAIMAGAAGGLLGGFGEVGKIGLDRVRQERQAPEAPVTPLRPVTADQEQTDGDWFDQLPDAEEEAGPTGPAGPTAGRFDELNDIPALSPVGPGVPDVQPGRLDFQPEQLPAFTPEEQPFPNESPEVAAARLAAEQQARLRPGGRLPVVPGVPMPGGYEQVPGPSVGVVRSGLRRGGRLSPVVPLAQQEVGEINAEEEGIQEGLQVAPAAAEVIAQNVQAADTPLTAPSSVPVPSEVPTVPQNAPTVPSAPPAAVPPVPQIPVSVPPVPVEKFQNEADIIDFIRDNIGRIKGKGVAKAGTEGYYGDIYKQMLGFGISRKLVTNKGNGQDWDVVVDDLRRAGYIGEGATVEDVQELIVRAAEKRRGGGEDMNAELRQQVAQYEAFQNEALNSSRAAGKDNIPVGQLLIGDKFKVSGEEFVVKDLIFDENDQLVLVEVEDGKKFGTQKVGADMVLFSDKDSYIAGEDDVEFLPKTERELTADEVVELDQKIRALQEKETLTVDEHQELKRLEQKRGQVFMEWESEQAVAADREARAKRDRALELAREQAQREADMKARAEAPLSAPDLRTQQDMLDKPPQDEMFSIGEARPSQQSFTARAFGVEGLRKMLDRYPELIPPATKKAILAFLDSPVMSDLDWTGLEVELTDWIGSGIRGTRIGRLIQFTTESAASTFPHEIAHILYDALPEKYQKAIEAERVAILKQRYQGNPPPDLLRGDMSSREFMDSKHDPDDYPLTNPSEYLAALFGDKVSQSTFANRHGQGMMAKIMGWLRGMLDTLQRAIGLSPDVERVMREMFAGKWQPNLQADAASDNQLSYRPDARAALNAQQMVSDPAARQAEGENQQAQVSSLIDFLNKYGITTSGVGAQRALRFLELAGIKASGEAMTGAPTDYATVKAARANDAPKAFKAAVSAASQLRLQEATMEGAVEKADAALAKLSRPAFAKELARESRLKGEADIAEAINQASEPLLESAIKMSQKALKEESKNDTEIARIESQMREVIAMKGSSSALSILVKDYVDVLSSSPEGIALLSDPDAKRGDLVKVYKDIKRSTQQPIYNDSLLNWGAFILTRSNELRDALWAANLARNSTIRAGMGAYETKFIADMERDQKGTIMREVRSAKRRQRNEDLSKFVYRTLHKKLLQEMEEAAEALEAGEVARGVLGDPDYQAYRKEVFYDAGVQGRTESFVPGKDEVFTLPSGKAVDLSMNGMQGTKIPTERWAEWDKAREELVDWLTNNPDHPDRGIHELNLSNLEEFYYNESVLSPHDRKQIFEGMINTILDSVRNAGGRWGAVVAKLVPQWSWLKEQAGHWSGKWSQDQVEARMKAMHSHPELKWKGVRGGKQPIEVVNNQFYDLHLNQVLYSLQGDAPMKVGDYTQSGMQVTQADLDDAKLQHNATAAAFKILERSFGRQNFVIDTRSGFVIQRKPGKQAEDMVPRAFDPNDQLFLRDFVELRKALKAAEPQAQPAITQKIIALIDKHWELVGYPYIKDRNPNFATATPFDGAGQAFELVAAKMEQYPSLISDFDTLVDNIMQYATATKDEVTQIILADMGKMFENGLVTEESNLIVTPVSGEKKNTFTRSRGPEMLPYSFYRYGFGTTQDVHRFSGMIHSRAIEEVLNGLRNIEKDLEQRQVELQEKAKKVGIPQAVKDRKLQRMQGEIFEGLDLIGRKLANVRKTIAYMVQSNPEDPSETSFARVIGGVQGSIIGNTMTTMRNIWAGWKYLGGMATRLNAKPLFDYPAAFFQVMLVQQSKALKNMLQAVLGGTLKTLPALGRAVRDAASPSAKGSRWRTFFGEAASAWLNETGTMLYHRQKDMLKMKARGLDYFPDIDQEWRNKMGAGLLAGGKLLEQPMHGAMNVAGNSVGAGIETINTFLKGMFSAMGEHALNAGIMRTLEGRHLPEMAQTLQRIYESIKNGQRQYDFTNAANPINRLDWREVFPRFSGGRFFSSEQDLQDLESFYQDAGLSAQTEFWKYLKQLEDGVKKPKYLSTSARNLLTTYLQGAVNKPTPMQQPVRLQQKDALTTLMKPLLGWSARTLNGMHRVLASVPAQAQGNDLFKARLKQYMMLSTLTILPALLAFSASGLMEEKASREVTGALWNQERSSRFPWEREGAKSQAIGWLINATYGIPFVDMLINTMVNDMPARASLDPNIVMINKAKDLARYVGGAIQTGDPAFGLPRLIEGFFPDARMILNRIESETGKQAGADVVALLRRNGPQDIIKPAGGGTSGPNFTELSPFGQRMENAAINEDYPKVQAIFQEAVEKARELGKDNPERLVRQMFQARNPFTRGLTTKMSNQQYTDFLNKLGPAERAKVERVVNAFDQAGQLIGTDPTFTREQRSNRGGGTAAADSYVSPLSRMSRARTSTTSASRGGSSSSSMSRLSRTRGRKRTRSRLSRVRSRRTRRRGIRRRTTA
jgi:hypothetical protein